MNLFSGQRYYFNVGAVDALPLRIAEIHSENHTKTVNGATILPLIRAIVKSHISEKQKGISGADTHFSAKFGPNLRVKYSFVPCSRHFLVFSGNPDRISRRVLPYELCMEFFYSENSKNCSVLADSQNEKTAPLQPNIVSRFFGQNGT